MRLLVEPGVGGSLGYFSGKFVRLETFSERAEILNSLYEGILIGKHMGEKYVFHKNQPNWYMKGKYFTDLYSYFFSA